MNSKPDPAPALVPDIRRATPADVNEIVRVTNRAFKAESFCVSGDRVDAAEIRQRFDSGVFFVIDDPADRSRLLASVYAAVVGGRGYLGLISVDDGAKSKGLSRQLVAAVENHCRDAGCSFLDITVVNAREDLFPFYTKFGFGACDVLPFPVPEKALRPLLLIKMSKPLRSPLQLAMTQA